MSDWHPVEETANRVLSVDLDLFRANMSEHTIFANRLKVIYKNGEVHDFTHVTFIRRHADRLIIHGETEVGGFRKNVNRAYKLERLRLMIAEFYTPRE